MNRAELRVFLAEWFCGCGTPEAAAQVLLDVLRLHPLYDHQEKLGEALPDEGVRLLVLYTLDHFDLTEHGGTIEGGWLTEKGAAVRAALEREALDDFEALLDRPYCAHGVDIGEVCDACRAWAAER